ncbi:MAG: formylglycine-generating enzyme family protein [Nitrospirae bacterium]|nr:formylglycine-generating enzyme family protein [Nitrospirota bacterium]
MIKKVIKSSQYTDHITGIEFIFVKGGCYQMGDTFDDGNDDEKPVHEVCVDDFYIGKYPVTLGEFRKFVNDTGYRTEAEEGGGSYYWNGSEYKKDVKINWQNPGFRQDEEHPGVCVSWNDCQKYINWLKQKPGFRQDKKYPVVCVSWNDCQEYINWLKQKSGLNYCLLTEAEWEYAARTGGKNEKYSGGNNVDDVAWYNKNSDGYTHKVGTKLPNGLGIYDMSGNVWEWVQDWYDSDYYKNNHKDNPQGPSSGSLRALRGGSWYNDPEGTRCVRRGSHAPEYRRRLCGFRLKRTP